MDDPELHSDETIIVTTPDVFVKSVPFEAILTNKRIILIDRRKSLIPPKDILLAAIRDVQSGENAIRDPNLAVSIITSSGETKQVVLTFPQKTGVVRKRERDEWAKAVREITASSAQRVIRTVMPNFRQELKRKTGEPSAPVKIKIVGRPPAEEATGISAPDGNAAGTGQPPQEPVGTETLPYGSFCTRCGNRIAPGSLFCNRCGAKVVYPGQKTIRQEPEATVPPEPIRVPAEPPGEIREQLRRTAVNPASTRSGPVRKGTGFFSRIFQKKKSPKTQVPSPEAPEPRPSEGSNGPGSRRRLFTVLAVIAVIVVVVGAGAFVYLNILKSPTTGPDESSGETGTPAVTVTTATHPVATSTATIVHTEATPLPIPTDGVYVRVSYIGAWKGSYGVVGALVPVTRSGEVMLKVENATGTVQAAFRKDDASTRPHELVVEIYKNGALVKRGVTTEPKGQVDISVNPATATPITVTTTATGTAATSTPAGNTTATQTTAPVTTGTTAH